MCLTCPDRASSPPRSPTPLFPHNQQSSTSPPVSPTDTTNAPPPPTARSVVVSPPPARVRATASRGVEGARSQVAVGESGRGGARNAPAPATPGGPALISVCARAATESQRGRRGAQRGDGGGGGGWGQRWRGRGGCGRLRCTRATASAARGGATGASFWRVAVRAQPRVLRSSDGGAAAAPRTLPNGGGPKASAAPRPVFLTDERGGGLLSGEPDGDDSRAPSVCVAGFGSATNCGAGVLLPRANESQGCP